MIRKKYCHRNISVQLAGTTYDVLNMKTLKLVDNRNAEIQLKREHFLRHNKFGLLITRGSAEMCLSGGQCYMGFVANFILFLAVTKF